MGPNMSASVRRASVMNRPTEDTDEDDEDQEVPQRLVEERWVEEFVLDVLDGPVLRRDVEPPRQARGCPEGLLVEEVAPPAYGLSQRQARRGDVQVGDGRQPAPQRVAAAEEETSQHAAVDGEPALPHSDDLGREAAVIVEVEGDVVETRADEPAEEPELAGLEQIVGIYGAPPGLPVGQPEADRHGARHQDAVPAEGQGAQLQDDGAGRVEHTASLIRPAFDAVK